MEKNCLVTTLKSNVNNETLIKVGEFIIDINLKAAAKCKLVSNIGTEGTITIIGDGFITYNNAQFKSIKYNEIGASFTIPKGIYKIKISNKYDIVAIENFPQINIDALKYTKGIYTFASNASFGNIENLKDCPIQYITILNGSGVYGNLSVISSSIKSVKSWVTKGCLFTGNISLFGTTGNNLVQIASCPNISGSIEELVASLVTNGYSSGRKELYLYNVNVTIGGFVRKLLDAPNVLVWTNSDTFYYQNGGDSDVSNPNIIVDIYAKNQSEAQIENWKSLNNNVIII